MGEYETATVPFIIQADHETKRIPDDPAIQPLQDRHRNGLIDFLLHPANWLWTTFHFPVLPQNLHAADRA
jgi:hypothetical protein